LGDKRPARQAKREGHISICSESANASFRVVEVRYLGIKVDVKAPSLLRPTSAVSVFYQIAYRIGFTPWEEAATERQPPLGAALDLGCGTGGWAIELARRGWVVTGVDLVPTAIAKARKRAADPPLGGAGRCGREGYGPRSGKRRLSCCATVEGSASEVLDIVDRDERSNIDLGKFRRGHAFRGQPRNRTHGCAHQGPQRILLCSPIALDARFGCTR